MHVNWYIRIGSIQNHILYRTCTYSVPYRRSSTVTTLEKCKWLETKILYYSTVKAAANSVPLFFLMVNKLKCEFQFHFFCFFSFTQVENNMACVNYLHTKRLMLLQIFLFWSRAIYELQLLTPIAIFFRYTISSTFKSEKERQ